MQGSEQLIAVYHAAFLIFLCLAVLFAAVSVFLFFKFRIRDVLDFITGRGEKRTIRQMEEENAKTGKLRQEEFVTMTTGDLERTPSGNIPKVTYPITEKMNTGTEQTEQMYRQQSQEGNEETVLLSAEPVTAEEEKAKSPGKFVITKEKMWIHTRETL